MIKLIILSLFLVGCANNDNTQGLFSIYSHAGPCPTSWVIEYSEYNNPDSEIETITTLEDEDSYSMLVDNGVYDIWWTKKTQCEDSEIDEKKYHTQFVINDDNKLDTIVLYY